MALEKTINEKGRNYLQLINPANGKKIFNPVSGKTGENILINNEKEVRTIVAEARESFNFWGSLTKKERKRFLKTFKHVIAAHADAIAQLIVEESGKPLVEAYEEIMVILDMLNYYQSKGLTDSRKCRGTSPVNMCKRIKTTMVPGLRGKQMGVAAAITPWNYSFMIPLNIGVRSLAYGNTIIIKASEQTPYAAEFIRHLTDKAWEKSGFDKSCEFSPIRIVQGDYTVGKLLVALLNEEMIDFILFCGSSGAGRKVKKTAKDKNKLELLLGGKDPFIILEDCDLDMTAGVVMGACLYNGGQSCSSTERVYVAEKIADTFIKKVLEKAKEMKVGYDPHDPYVDIGPMMNPHQGNIIMDHIQDAEAKGAEILFGGKRLTGGTDGIYDKGYYIEPTVLVNVNHNMKIMTEETFGPMIPIMTFKTEEEAIQLANDSRFGLTASIWTKDIERGEKLAEKIKAGTVYVNDTFWTASEPRVHWPGAKESGNFIDEQAPYKDKVIAVTRGNLIDKASFFWLKKNTPKKLRIIKTLVRYAYKL